MKSHLLFWAMLLPCASARCPAQMFPPQFREIRIEARPGAQLPLNAVFRDQYGTPVHLGDYFGGKPVLLMPVYYTCTTLCGEALRGMVEAIGLLHSAPGRDFQIVAFSINPEEGSADALKKLNDATMNYNGKRGGPGWHFLTGSNPSIEAVTQAIGFHYRYDAPHHMYVHASGMMIATPDGRISRYLYGVTYQPQDVQQAISDAAQYRIPSPIRAQRLLCYPFMASNAKYNGPVLLALRCAAAATLIALIAAFISLWRFDARRHREPIARRVAS